MMNILVLINDLGDRETLIQAESIMQYRVKVVSDLNEIKQDEWDFLITDSRNRLQFPEKKTILYSVNALKGMYEFTRDHVVRFFDHLNSLIELIKREEIRKSKGGKKMEFIGNITANYSRNEWLDQTPRREIIPVIVTIEEVEKKEDKNRTEIEIIWDMKTDYSSFGLGNMVFDLFVKEREELIRYFDLFAAVPQKEVFEVLEIKKPDDISYPYFGKTVLWYDRR